MEHNYPNSQSNSTTASTTNKTGQTKSLGEESVRRILKKNKAKAQSRPSSGNKNKINDQGNTERDE